jgi:hypothetical protein
MKGSDLTQRQPCAAALFIKGRIVGVIDRELTDETPVAHKWCDLVRLVAWYGAIRAEATANGADPNNPGQTFRKRGSIEIPPPAMGIALEEDQAPQAGVR